MRSRPRLLRSTEFHSKAGSLIGQPGWDLAMQTCRHPGQRLCSSLEWLLYVQSMHRAYYLGPRCTRLRVVHAQPGQYAGCFSVVLHPDWPGSSTFLCRANSGRAGASPTADHGGFGHTWITFYARQAAKTHAGDAPSPSPGRLATLETSTSHFHGGLPGQDVWPGMSNHSRDAGHPDGTWQAALGAPYLGSAVARKGGSFSCRHDSRSTNASRDHN